MEQTNGLINGKNNVNHPAHYTQGGIECIDAMKAATVNKKPFEAVLVGNVIKYLWRYESKGGLEDVEKALWYLTRLHKEIVECKMQYKVVATEKGIGLETPWHTLMFPKEGDMFVQNTKQRAELLKALLERGGFCPCQTEQSRDTMCPCKSYRKDGKCICGMFVKFPQVVQGAENTTDEVKTDGETESIGTDAEAKDSTEQQEAGVEHGTDSGDIS